MGLSESENVAESGGEGEDSDEEEWNYFKGEEKSNSELTKEELEVCIIIFFIFSFWGSENSSTINHLNAATIMLIDKPF